MVVFEVCCQMRLQPRANAAVRSSGPVGKEGSVPVPSQECPCHHVGRCCMCQSDCVLRPVGTGLGRVLKQACQACPCLYPLSPDLPCPVLSVSWLAPPTADHHDALLDVFRRQYFAENGRPTKWDKAAYFAVLIRYAKTLEASVLSASGRCGLYVEPKTEDAMQPHSDYQVIWLPSLDYAAVAHKAKCEAHCLGIARTGRWFGLRVRAQHFQEVFSSVKPEAVYLAPGSRVTYHTGPWPYGCDRKSIAKALRDVGWECRPLQPLHSVTGGLVWAVQANCEPPTSCRCSMAR